MSCTARFNTGCWHSGYAWQGGIHLSVSAGRGGSVSTQGPATRTMQLIVPPLLLPALQRGGELGTRASVSAPSTHIHTHTRKDLYIRTEALTFRLHTPTIISQAHKLAINTSGHRQNLFLIHKDTDSEPHHTPCKIYCLLFNFFLNF